MDISNNIFCNNIIFKGLRLLDQKNLTYSFINSVLKDNIVQTIYESMVFEIIFLSNPVPMHYAIFVNNTFSNNKKAVWDTSAALIEQSFLYITKLIKIKYFILINNTF